MTELFKLTFVKNIMADQLWKGLTDMIFELLKKSTDFQGEVNFMLFFFFVFFVECFLQITN